MTVKEDALKEARKKIDNQFGAGSLILMGEKGAVVQVEAISTGVLTLDRALGIGGVPRGRIVEIFGPEACLDADAFVLYSVRTPEGRRQNHKGGSIERLYERFHGLPSAGSGRYQRPVSEGSHFFAPSMNEEGCIYSNRIMDVVATGEKPVYEVLTNSGQRVTASEDHRFWTGTGYARLSELEVGATVFIHNKTPNRRRHGVRHRRPEIFVKHHPVAAIKVVRDRERGYAYEYRRLRRSRAVVEAVMNDLTLDEYVARLNAGDLDGLEFLPRVVQVHHQDENPSNDDETNLVPLDPVTHGRLHATRKHNDLRFVAVPDEVAKITARGTRRTYDIRMEGPHHNYVADGFVVHNSGKTTLVYSIIAQAQKAGGTCAFVDSEHRLDPVYAARVGVDVHDLLLSQPDYGEQALEIVDELIRSGAVDVVAIDSVAALTPRAEMEGQMGDQHVGLLPRMMAQGLRKLAGNIRRANAVCVFTNQIREKVGIVYGSPETQPGGRALKFFASQRMDIRRIEQIKVAEQIVGHRARVKVVKNSCAAPYQVAEFDIEYGRGASSEGCLLDLGTEAGLITKAGAYLNYGEESWHGRAKAKTFLAGNREVAMALEEAIRCNGAKA